MSHCRLPTVLVFSSSLTTVNEDGLHHGQIEEVEEVGRHGCQEIDCSFDALDTYLAQRQRLSAEAEW